MTDHLAAAILGRSSVTPARLSVGTVQSLADSNGVMTVEVETTTTSAMALSPATSGVSVGDAVLVARQGSASYVVAKLGAPPPPPPPSEPDPIPPTPPKPTYATKTVTFRPTFTGSYRNGGWRTDRNTLICGDWTSYGINYGRAFYGSGPSGLKKVTKVNWADVRIRRRQGGVFGAQTLPMVLITDKSRPGGSGTVKATTSGPGLAVGQETTWRLPGSWAADLVSGAAGGLGIGTGAYSPYIVTEVPSTWSSGWVLRVNYTYQTS